MSRDYASEEIVKLQSEIRTLKDEKRSLVQMLAAKDAEIERLKKMCRKLTQREHALLGMSSCVRSAPEQKPETCVWKEIDADGITAFESCCRFHATLFEKPDICPSCGKRVEVRG